MIVNNPLRGDRAAGKRARQLITDYFKHSKRPRHGSVSSEATTRKSISSTMTLSQKRALSTNHEDPEVVPIPKRISVETPDYFTINLKYHDSGTIDNPTTGNYWTPRCYRLNSVYQPGSNSIGTAHQPNGFDKWSAIYSYYRVLRARVLLTIHNQSGSNAVLTCCGVSHDQTAISSAGSKDVLGEMKHFELQPAGTRDGGNAMVVYTRDIYPGEYQPDIAQATGASSSGDAKSAIWTSVSADPVVPLYIHFGHTDWGANTAVTCRYSLQIEYTVQFREWGTSAMNTSD